MTTDPRRARLLWQCRRGMRELDDLLLAFMSNRYDAAPAGQKAAFEALLQLPDPELAGYLLRGLRAATPEADDVIEQIRGHAAP
jgi:antitoxin CptB